MFLITFTITAFTVVLAQDLLGVSYRFDTDFLSSFTQKNCGNTARWELVNYDRLKIEAPSYISSMAIRASRNSCVSSFPIVFLNGTLEVTVYLRTISKNSGITISVFDEDGNLITVVKYQRINKNFKPGWTVVFIPITKQSHGYVQLLGQSLSSEFVIVDSLRYTPEYSTTFMKDEQTLHYQSSPDVHTRLLVDHIEDEPFILEFYRTDGSGGEEDIEGSGGIVDTESPGTDDPGTEQPGSGTEEPDSAEIIDDPEESGFWNAFTITLVSAGVFVVVGSIGVGTYYLGKNAGRSQRPPLDLETLETPIEIIPRARSVYSDRFSRFS